MQATYHNTPTGRVKIEDNYQTIIICDFLLINFFECKYSNVKPENQLKFTPFVSIGSDAAFILKGQMAD